MELWDAVENLLSKRLFLLSEVKAGQKQGVELQGSRSWSSLGAELMQGSSRRGETLGGAQVWQPSAGTGRAAAQPTPLSSPSEMEEAWPKKNEVEAHFLVLSQTSRVPTCFSLCVLVSYARGCLDPCLATQVLFFVPPAEGPAWPVFVVE